MTHLTRPVRRSVVSGTLSRDALVVELTEHGIRMREKSRRTWYGPIGYGQLYLHLARLTVDARKRAKQAAKKTKRTSRGLLHV